MPNTASAIRAGVTCVCGAELPQVEALLGRVGTVVRLEERLMDAATAVSGVAPAYVALLAEAWIDAAVGQGIPAAQAAMLVGGALSGSAALLGGAWHGHARRAQGGDLARRDDRSRTSRTRAGRATQRVRGCGRRGRRAEHDVILALTNVRGTIADFVLALTWVYTLVIFAYILSSLAFTAGLRVAYSRTSDAILGFLRDVCEPYLRIFRRILPSFGGLDFSPIIGIIVLQVVGQLVANAIR